MFESVIRAPATSRAFRCAVFGLAMPVLARLGPWAWPGWPAGRISLFAAVAEWRTEPNAIFQAALDVMPLKDIVRLVYRFANGASAGRDGLLKLLEEKEKATHVRNIDLRGLANLIPVIEAVAETVSRGRPGLARLTSRLQASHDAMVKAISSSDDRHVHVKAALAELEEAANLLRTSRRS